MRNTTFVLFAMSLVMILLAVFFPNSLGLFTVVFWILPGLIFFYVAYLLYKGRD